MADTIRSILMKWLSGDGGLHLKEVDGNMPFVSLGLDSVGAASVALEIEKVTGVRLSSDILYEYPTINKLAKYLTSREKARQPPLGGIVNGKKLSGQQTTKSAKYQTPTNDGIAESMSKKGGQHGRTTLAGGQQLLNTVHDGILHEELEDSFWLLAAGLRSIRATCSSGEWDGFIKDCLAHPIRDLLHQEPFTRHGFERPRGYQGDAGLIDYLYMHGTVSAENLTKLGFALHQVAVRFPSGFSVRYRRDFAAKAIDSVADRVVKPAILSVACGHLREAGRSKAIQEGRIGRMLAIDQDPESIRIVTENYAHKGIDARCQSADDLIRVGESIGRFDLIYALGLYDYLPIQTGRLLTSHLFNLLKPNGTLLVANFLPGCLEIGYMEAFMRWNLVYRTPEELRALCNPLPPEEVTEINAWAEDAGCIGYLTVKRK